MTIAGGFGVEIRFNDHFDTGFVTTLNYIINIKFFNSLSLVIFPVTDLNDGDSPTASMKTSPHGLPYE